MARASVVIPAHNSAADISACLEAIQASTTPDLEIIVVDDRSTDNTADIARLYGARVIANPGPDFGAAAARNAGARLASGEIVVFIDSDVCVHPATIERALAQFDADPKLGAVTGSYDDRPHAPGDVSQWRNLLHCYTHRTAHVDTQTFWTGFGAVRRDVFWNVGGMDVNYGFMEDMDLGTRLARAGVKLRLDATLEVQHRKAWSLRSMVRTDLFGRAIPYTKILLREGMPNDLNVRWSQRASVALTGLAMLLALLAPWWGWVSLAGAVLSIAAIAGINLDYYRFLSATRGVGFALRTFPLHLIYFAVAGLGFGIAQVRYGLAGPLAVFFALALAFQAAQGAFGADAYDADEPAHIVTGLMVREYVANLQPTSPIAFARNYYQHYPKVGLGHWPPVFYAMQAGWTLLFRPTRDSLLVMMALLAALLATGVWRLVREWFGSLAAWCAGVILLATPGVAFFEARVMTEIPLALLLFGAMFAYGRYLDSGRSADALQFGIWSLLCLLTKGTGLVVAALPPLGILLTGRWHLMRRLPFWLPAPIAGTAAVWYLFAPDALHQKVAAFGGPGLDRGRLHLPPAIWSGQFGWVLACLVLLGMLWLLGSRLRGVGLDGMRASVLAMALAGTIFPMLFAVWETRHQVEESGAFVLLAMIGLGALLTRVADSPRAKAALFIALTAIVLQQTVPRLTGQRSRGYEALADGIVAGPARVVLVCCDGESEGALIAAVAEREPSPRRFLLRGTQVVVDSDWMAYRVTSKVQTVAEMERLLEDYAIDLVVLEQRDKPEPGRDLLETALSTHSEEWTQVSQPPLLWFTRAEPLELSDAERERRLRPLLPNPLQ